MEDQCTDRAYRIGATKDVHVYTVGAVHPVLEDNSYDVILDRLLQSRREVSRRIFVSSEITATDFLGALNKSARGKDDEILRAIDHGGYLDLEEFVRDRLLTLGFDANLTKRSGDGGADIVVRNEIGELAYLIQCKFTSNVDVPVDAGLLVDAERVRVNWKAPTAVVIGISNAKRFAPRVVDGFKNSNGRLIARGELTSFLLGQS